MAHRISLTDPTHIAIRRSWGRRWGAFGKIEGRGDNLLILAGIMNGMVVHCTDAPTGVNEQYTGIVKFKNGQNLLVLAYKIRRSDLISKGWRYMTQYEPIVDSMIKSGLPYYEA